MKNILVPTDFSFYAELAFNSAIVIAKKWGGKIFVLHKADLPSGWEDFSETRKNQELKDPHQLAAIEEKFKELKKMGSKENVEISTQISTGNLIPCLQNFMLENDIDMIVMGSHGASGKEEFFIGSNAQKAIRKLHIPILVVKSPMKDERFSKVLFATGLSKSDEAPFERFIEFVRPFNPTEIHIMAVDTTSYFSQPTIVMKKALEMFQKIASPLHCQSHFHRDFSIEAGIRHLSEELDIDLIGISNRERHPFKRMFQGSNVELLVNHSNIPVLAIDY